MFSVEPEAVLSSAGTESSISAETASAASAASPALLGVLPMGADPDSLLFSAALSGCGGAYLGVVSEHAAQRGMFAGAQGMAAGVTSATEVERTAAMLLGG